MTYTPDQIQAIVESAGRTLMMLPRGFGCPQGHRSCWPETLKEMLVFMNEEGDGLEIIMPENDRIKLRPSLRQMNEYEKVMDWMIDLALHCRKKEIPWVINTVWLAMLRYPVCERRVLSWRRIGRKFGKDVKTVQKYYQDGIRIITRLQNAKVMA